MNTRRGRFAPTPSGYMHLGNALAALLAWLQMRACGGTIMLRIEDLDQARTKPAYIRALQEDLEWLGLDFDEGPSQGGPHAPYVQSERRDHYDRALAVLQEKGLLYPCYCSRAELASLALAPHGLADEGTAYPGTCRNLTPSERLEKARAKNPSLRFALPDVAHAWCDGGVGPYQTKPGFGGDFIVKRADGVMSYQLAVVVDDADMMITDVLRGRDLLDSTPRQLALYRALGKTPPTFTHIPLLVTEDGQRLAKRDQALSLSALRAQKMSAEAVVGCLAHACGLQDECEPVKARDLIPLYQTINLDKATWSMPDQLRVRFGL